jgi:predicted  nucleic acid-binding Zn-ribbon protein
MNLVGKIFIVLIFVMSLVWMSFSLAVYSTHQNWKDLVKGEGGLEQQLQQAQERVTELKDREAKLQSDLDTEKTARRMTVTKLEAENRDLKNQRVQQERDLADLVQERDDALAALKATQEAERALRDEIMGDGQEVVGLREQVRLARAERDKQFDEAVKTQEALHQALFQLQTLRDRAATLTADLADARKVLDKHGLKPIPALYEDIPYPVEGLIAEVGSDGKMIEINIGSDDGLMSGHKLEVYRVGDVTTYLGRVEVTQTEPDKAVCKVLPEFLQRPLQRGDRVTAKLQ